MSAGGETKDWILAGHHAVLREAGVPADHPALENGVRWLSANQRESGRWFTRSLNGVPEHYISDTATVFAVLALKACGVNGP